MKNIKKINGVIRRRYRIWFFCCFFDRGLLCHYLAVEWGYKVVSTALSLLFNLSALFTKLKEIIFKFKHIKQHWPDMWRIIEEMTLNNNKNILINNNDAKDCRIFCCNDIYDVEDRNSYFAYCAIINSTLKRVFCLLNSLKCLINVIIHYQSRQKQLTLKSSLELNKCSNIICQI